MFLEVTDISKSYGSAAVLRGLSLSLPAGQTLAILGRSGCGKTTLLKMIAGLTEADSGRMVLAGRDLRGVPPQRRGAVYLYQEALLFPHLNVFENVAFGLRIRRLPEADIRQQVGEMLRELGLTEHADKMPDALSGGQRQRVAFGRALIVKPALLLLDEPFGNLDAETRADMQKLFREVAAAHHMTAIVVTHDVKEALVMGDAWALMDAGVLTQYADLQAFREDARTGMSAELAFWKTIM